MDAGSNQKFNASRGLRWSTVRLGLEKRAVMVSCEVPSADHSATSWMTPAMKPEKQLVTAYFVFARRDHPVAAIHGSHGAKAFDQREHQSPGMSRRRESISNLRLHRRFVGRRGAARRWAPLPVYRRYVRLSYRQCSDCSQP